LSAAGHDVPKTLFSSFFGLFLKPERTAGIQGMWQPYIVVIQEHAPQTVLAFDKLHLAGKMLLNI